MTIIIDYFQPSAAINYLARTAFSLFVIIALGCGSVTDKSASEDQAFRQFLAKQHQQDLSRSPMMQSYLGIKTDYDRWADLSENFADESEQINEQRLQQLAGFDLSKLSAANQLSARLYRHQLEQWQRFKPFRHHGYVMQQFSGWHTEIPSFLINMHQITSVADAEDYISRLYGIRKLIEQVHEQMTIRADKGMYPPQWTYPQMLTAARAVIAGQPFDESKQESTLLADISRKISALDTTEQRKQQLLDDAQAAMLNAVGPSYRALIATLERQQQDANRYDGVWSLPDGNNYYRLLLSFHTTTDMTAEQIHQLGLTEVQRLQQDVRSIMQQVKFDGDNTDFFQFVRESEQFFLPDSAAGRHRYLEQTRKVMASMEARLPKYFNLLPKAPLQVKAVEAFRERSAGKAFYQSPAADGSRPGIYYVNLFDMKGQPFYQLEALAYHEGLPGHHMQRAIAVELENIPEFQKYASFTAYTEGWGLYAEHLGKEMGGYQDPYSDFGRISMELWRACRLVVDTGLHAKRWTREQAIDYMMANTPNTYIEASKEIERYSVYPGQATSYLIGKIKILSLREWARSELGEQFDIRAFHDEVLKDGPVPLNILEEKIRAWVESARTLTLH